MSHIFSQYVTDSEKGLSPLSSKWMCSRQCPCASTLNVPPLSNLNATALAQYNRTYNSSVGESTGTVFMYFSSNSTSYLPKTFSDCYYDWLEDFIAAGSKKGQTPTTWLPAG